MRQARQPTMAGMRQATDRRPYRKDVMWHEWWLEREGRLVL